MKSKPIVIDGISTIPHVTQGTPAPLPDALFREFDCLMGQLSPENLTCDGELPRSRVAAKLASLRRSWKALEAKAGRKVSEEEVGDRSWAEWKAERKARGIG